MTNRREFLKIGSSMVFAGFAGSAAAAPEPSPAKCGGIFYALLVTFVHIT